MKRLFIALVLLSLCASTFAQNQDTILKFMGIPIDGTKRQMIAELKKKGFEESDDADALVGVFNGRLSNVYVHTNHDVVDRVFVADANTSNVADIRIAYNNLLRQFEKNDKYFCIEDFTIPHEEDISYEMTVNNKRYEASFHQLPNDAGDSDLSLHKYLLEEFTEEQIADTTDISKALMVSARKLQFYNDVMNSSVWFLIGETYGGYRIILYYDNEYNHKEGEDL